MSRKCLSGEFLAKYWWVTDDLPDLEIPVEHAEELADEARRRIDNLAPAGYREGSLTCQLGDGETLINYRGWWTYGESGPTHSAANGSNDKDNGQKT